MTNNSPGKPPIPPEKLNMIFGSSDFAKLMESNDMDISKVFESTDSAAALFRSADFLKSLDAYKESLANGQPPSSNSSDADNKTDPPPYFRSVDFLKSLDSLPKDTIGSGDGTGGGADYSAYFRSVDTLPKDFLKSLDSLPKEEAKAPPVLATAPVTRGGPKDLYTSRDWMGQYGPEHVDVAYNKNSIFQSGDSDNKNGGAAATAPKASSASNWMKLYESSLKNTASAKPKPAPAPAADWGKMYETVLKNPKQSATAPATPSSSMPPLTGTSALAAAAAAVAEPALSQAPEAKPAAAKPKKKRVYKSRKVIPEVKTFVQFTDNDVLLGRGGLSNKHPGNKRYRQEIENAKPVYRAASKDEKTQWAQLLVDYVHKYGGRFLEKDKATNQWYIVPDVVARRKAGQALREDNTPESRAEKRERYKRNHQNKSP